MRYEYMFPEQIKEAVKKNIPVVLPVGVIEYHSEHLCLGVDTLLVLKALEEIEKEIEIIVLPPFFYGCASYAVESPEEKGTIHIKPEVIYNFAKNLFENLLRIGFRNIYVIIHHQTENFVSGMPTDLSFKLAAREVIFEFLERKYGEGWWGKEESKNYYNQHKKGIDPFSWIKILPFMDKETQKKYPIDHAGKQETSLMMTFCPEGVDMKRFKEEKWYSREAKKASKDYGEKAKKEIVEKLKKLLRRENV
ncbi:MAG: creatininase family protein [Candidatus Omnitrophica bacterium]|nr:creatininase family protein [Candidatus Omnitrophota bacterium]